MQKNCYLFVNDRGVTGIDVLPFAEAQPDARAQSGHRMHRSLSEADFVLIRHPKMDIEMENRFWTGLQIACERKQLSPQIFIEQAKADYPDALPSDAVRMAICAYFTESIGWT